LAAFSHEPVALPEQPLVAFVGALERVKGIDVLLDAWPSVVARVPQARLVVAGQGRLRGEVSRRAGSLPSVEVAGALDAAGVAALLDRSWVLAAPSRSEGFGRVALEAATRARAVVASAVGGLADVVRDGESGVLVPVGDGAALAAALAGLLSDRDQAARMGRAGREASLADPALDYDAGVERLAAWLTAG
jgi:glycosyltransferase involved in cell wall biosynthesis